MSSENKESVSKADTNVKLTENSLKPNVVQQNTKPGSYFKFNDNKLLFFTTNENYKILEEKCKNEDGNGKVIPGEFRIFVECGSDKFCITGPHSSCQDVDDGKKSVSITSVRKQNFEGTVSKDPLEMMYKVGLDENKKLVEITRMSINPFKTTTPNLNATTIQRTVNNDSETTTTDQQRALSQELVANEPKAVGELKFVGEKLLLVTTSDQFEKCKDYRNTQSANPDELLMFIKCGANEYRIVGNSTEGSILIKSILRKSEGDKYIDGNILRVEEEIRSVKKMLDGVTEVKVDSISNQPFGVKIPTTTAQQTVNNTTIDQPTSSAVTNEHKETLVNAHEEKDEHNNAASNRKVQQAEVDAEVKILMEDLLSKVSAQDLDKVEKTPISKRSEEEEFYDAEDKQLSSITSDDDTLEFQDAIDDGITQPCLITSDMVVEQVETQNTVGRVLNKS